MEITTDKFTLKCDAWSKTFNFPIGDALEFDSVVVVLLRVHTNQADPQNVIGLDRKDGAEIWRAPIRSCYGPEDVRAYWAIEKRGSKLVLNNGGYILLDVDPATGTILHEEEFR